MSYFVPTCPNGHEMRLRTARRKGTTCPRLWDAYYICKCGWIAPKYSSTDMRLAQEEAMRYSGIRVIPADHIMDEEEVRNYVTAYVIGRGQ